MQFLKVYNQITGKIKSMIELKQNDFLIFFLLNQSFVDLTGCIVEVLNLNRLLREQKTLNSIKKNTNTIIQMLRKSKINGSINLALESKNSDPIKSTNVIKVFLF